jgi:AhpD family alkylhydroperoxidase
MNEKIKNYREERIRLNEQLLSKEHDADILKRVYAMDTYTYHSRQKGLSPKYKEILGLVTSMVLRCDDCVKYHLEKCFELGVADDEMMDIFGVANVVGGTIVIPHTRRAIEYWDNLLNERPEPSPFSTKTKTETYNEVLETVKAMLEGVENLTSRMATIVEIVCHRIPYYYWTGFYLLEKEKYRLTVGPYQGTHGCLFIKMGEGVCGRSAQNQETIVVEEIHSINDLKTDEGNKMHIVCDPRCQSEIVVPVLDKNGNLIAVFDVDSLHKKAFDEVDKEWLEKIMSFVSL